MVVLLGVDIVAGLRGMDLDAEMTARRTRHEIAGVVVPLIPPDDNILLKGLMGRGPEVDKHERGRTAARRACSLSPMALASGLGV